MCTMSLADYRRDLSARPESRTLSKATMTPDGQWVWVEYVLTRDATGLHDRPREEDTK